MTVRCIGGNRKSAIRKVKRKSDEILEGSGKKEMTDTVEEKKGVVVREGIRDYAAHSVKQLTMFDEYTRHREGTGFRVMTSILIVYNK